MVSFKPNKIVEFYDIWFYQFKDETSESGSAPKTPQDVTSLSSMPLTVQLSTLETPPSGIITEEMVDHPLSPSQEQVSDAIVCKKIFYLISS